MSHHPDRSDHALDGTVEERADGVELRFERHLRHPVEKVWAALTSPAQLGEWLAPGEFELAVGGRVHLVFADGDGVIAGQVTAVTPLRVLEFTWTDEGNDFGFVRWELTANGSGTRLVLTHTVPETARSFGLPALAGWHSMLENLVTYLNGQPVVIPVDRWQTLYDHYARAGLIEDRSDKGGM